MMPDPELVYVIADDVEQADVWIRRWVESDPDRRIFHARRLDFPSDVRTIPRRAGVRVVAIAITHDVIVRHIIIAAERHGLAVEGA